MVYDKLVQMARTEGDLSRIVLRKMAVFRGGFTYEAGYFVSEIENELQYRSTLITLSEWGFVRFDVEQNRFTVNPAVSETVGQDISAHVAHFYWFLNKATEQMEQNTYDLLGADEQNVAEAMKRVLDARQDKLAFVFLIAIEHELIYRNHLRQFVSWSEVVANLIETNHNSEDYEHSQRTLAEAYFALSQKVNRIENLSKSIGANIRALQNYERSTTDIHYALVLNNLGLAYSALSENVDEERSLSNAIICYHRSLEILETDMPNIRYDMVQYALAHAYQSLSKLRNRESNLLRAVDIFSRILTSNFDGEESLYMQTRNDVDVAYNALLNAKQSSKKIQMRIEGLEDYLDSEDLAEESGAASTYTLLGHTYSILSELQNPVENLKHAISATKIAMELYSKTDYQLDYAGALMNLGSYYGRLAWETSKTENLEIAEGYYIKALKIYKPEVAPYFYAMTQNSLGLVYRGLSRVRSQEQNLLKAGNAFKSALRMWGNASHESEYATIMNNLEFTSLELSDVRNLKESTSTLLDISELLN